MSYSIWAGAKHHWPEWVQLANTHYQSKQYDSAYTYYFKLTHQSSQENIPDSTKAESYRKLGIILYLQEQYEKSIENFKLASEHFNFIKDIENEHKCWSNMANVYVKLEKYELAEKLYQLRLEYALKTKNKADQLSTLVNMSGLFNHSNQYHRAAEHLMKAQIIAVALNDTLKMEMIFHNLSAMYLKQRMPDSALYYLHMSSTISNDLILKEGALWNLQELHYQLGNKDSAYFYLHKYNTVADSLKNGEIAFTIAKLEAELHLEKDKVRFASLMNWVIGLIILLVVGIVWWLIEKRRTQKRINELQTLSKMFIEQLKAHENEKTEVGSVVHSSVLPGLVAAKNHFYVGNNEKGKKQLQESTVELSDLKNNQLYTRRFNQSDWFRHTPTNAKNNYNWIEIIGFVDPKVFTFEYKVATISILEQILQDGQQSITIFPDEYGVEIRFINPISFSKTTQTLLSFFDCTVQPNKIHIPLHENQL